MMGKKRAKISNDERVVSDLGYKVNLQELCKTQNFDPDQVVNAELVFPKGAVPNSKLIWLRIDLTNKVSKHITLPLSEFHKYVILPESTLGGILDHGS